MATVGEVDEFFANACYQADLLLGEPAGCRHFLNWFDDEEREDVVPQLLKEVERELAVRAS
jgi:hypothetical protein